ncbi:ABC transporter permease [Putridiphycobacter roseus]|uniref:ABC transporter permease n=1 Tax=Putridiphycobacter roseus TaxID=2219161 RepID=A0A2W1N322_9FLAO|nr:ABC transporter permease [Putridiphycobacter roseus]PZE18717.1 ABC transporter permease [Putridiphycobacter roseus]
MSNLSIIWDISKTHLFSKKKQTMVAALGVTFGISMFIIMMSFMTGLNQLLDGLVLNRTPHVQIYNNTDPTETQPTDSYFNAATNLNYIHSIKPKSRLERIHNALPILSELKKNKKVNGATPQTICKVFYIAGSNNLNGIISGIDVTQEARLFNFKDYIVEGDINSLIKKKNGVLLGSGIAEKLSLSVGDKIQILNPSGTSFSLSIGGIYQSGMAEIDDIQSYVNLKMAQQILGAGSNYISRIHVKLNDMEDAVPFSKLIENIYDVSAMDIKEANAQFDTGSSIRTLISYAVSITLLIVAGFGIYNILNMFIYEKMNDIAILKATGFTGRDVMLIFIFQALIIGVLGAALGLGVGYGASVIIDNIPFNSEALPTVKTYPVNYDPLFYITGIIFALVSTFLAGYLPARKAKKLDPVEIIRGQ